MSDSCKVVPICGSRLGSLVVESVCVPVGGVSEVPPLVLSVSSDVGDTLTDMEVVWVLVVGVGKRVNEAVKYVCSTVEECPKDITTSDVSSGRARDVVGIGSVTKIIVAQRTSEFLCDFIGQLPSRT